MPDQRVLDYIKKCFSKNFSEDQIRLQLLKVGYQEDFLNEHFDLVKKENIVKQNISKEQTLNTQPKQDNQQVAQQVPDKKKSKMIFTIVSALILIIAIVIFFIYINSLV